MTELEQELAELDRDLRIIELAEAKRQLSVYAGLHLPQDIERDDDDDDADDKPTSIASRYVPALHHREINHRLEQLESGELVDGRTLDRLMILAPPGSAKSTYASVLFPAWYMGRNPRHSIIAASQTTKLAERFGRRTRNLVASSVHWSIFGSGLAPDQRAAGSWETNQGGEYYSTGAQPFAGRRCDLAITDDLLRGVQDADSATKRESLWEWILSDLRPRMKPNAKWIYITTRWHQDDPAGRMLPADWNGQSGWVKARDGEWWYVLSFVAIIETEEEAKFDPLHRKVGDILWPEWFTDRMLTQMRRTLPRRMWNSLYQQKPVDDEGGILKRQHWRLWPHDKPPECEYIITVYDTAMEEGEQNDYSARTTWGVFWHEEPPKVVPIDPKAGWYKPPISGRYCCFLMDAWQDKLEFPELRKQAKEHYFKVKPDRVLVEKKVSGISLIQELKRAGIPVKGIPADKSKLARAHASSVVLEDGCVFYPDRRWAEDVIDRCAKATFIKGDPGNDMPDTCVHAWNYLRKGFHLQTNLDPEDEDADDSARDSDPGSKLFG